MRFLPVVDRGVYLFSVDSGLPLERPQARVRGWLTAQREVAWISDRGKQCLIPPQGGRQDKEAMSIPLSN